MALPEQITDTAKDMSPTCDAEREVLVENAMLQAEVARLTAENNVLRGECGRLQTKAMDAVDAARTAETEHATACVWVKRLAAELNVEKGKVFRLAAELEHIGFMQKGTEAAMLAMRDELNALAVYVRDARIKALRDAAAVCDKNEHVSGWVSRDVINAMIEKDQTND